MDDHLRLVEERTANLESLRKMLDRSIEDGGEATERDIDAALEAKAAELEQAGSKRP